MGILIKNNFGTVVDNHDGGVVIASVDDALKTAKRVSETMGADNLEDADYQNITPEQAEALTVPQELPIEILEAPSKTFTQNSDFIKNLFAGAVMKHYKGSPTNLAFIAVVCDDWGMLKSRSQTLNFVRCCFAVGAIPFTTEEEVVRINETVKKQLNGQWRYECGTRFKDEGLPPDYKTWEGALKDKIEFCDDIAKEFEGKAGMQNRFEARRSQQR